MGKAIIIIIISIIMGMRNKKTHFDDNHGNKL